MRLWAKKYHHSVRNVAMVLVAAVALGSSTYAWFVNNTQVTATDVTVTAQTAYSLMIKHYNNGTYGTTTALNTGNINLVPVSTIGGTAQDGIKFYKSDAWDKDANVKTFTDATVTNTDTANTSDLTSVAYTDAANPGSPYYVDTVYFKAGQTSKLYLDSTSTGLVDGTKTGVQNAITKFSESDNDLVKAMRIGILVSDKDGKNGKFFVYRLNDTESTNKANTTATTLTAASANGLTAGVASTTDTTTFTNANIATFGTSIPTLDSQTVQGNASALATAGTDVKPLYDFSVTGANNKEECKAVIYIWMEGCDYDTVAANTTAFKQFANKIQLGFCVGEAQ